MIKIVRKSKKVTCRGCGAVLKFEPEDVIVEYYDVDNPKDIRTSYVQCPICKCLYFFR